MWSFDNRLRSFEQGKQSWPHPDTYLATPETLADAGFYWDPSRGSKDNVVCFLCSKSLDGWSPDDDPGVEHLSHSRFCAWAILKSIPPTEDGELPFRWDDEEELPTGDRMTMARIQTFGDWWPHENKKGWIGTKKKMASAGFFFAPMDDSDDNAQCPYCGTALDGWEAFDIPINEHQRRAPNCPFFAKRSTAPTKASAAKVQRKKLVQSTEAPETVVSKTLLSPKSQKVHLHGSISKGAPWQPLSIVDPPPTVSFTAAVDRTRPGPSDMVPAVKNARKDNSGAENIGIDDLLEPAIDADHSTAPPSGDRGNRRRGGTRKAKDEGLRKMDEGMESDEFERLIQKPMKKPEPKRPRKSAAAAAATASSTMDSVVREHQADMTVDIKSAEQSMHTKTPTVSVVIHQRKKRKTGASSTVQAQSDDDFVDESGRSARNMEANDDAGFSDGDRPAQSKLASTKGKGRKRDQPAADPMMPLSGEEGEEEDTPTVTKGRSKKAKEGAAKRTTSRRRKTAGVGKTLKKKAPKAIIEIFPVDDEEDEHRHEQPTTEGEGAQAYADKQEVSPEEQPPMADTGYSTPPSRKSWKAVSHDRSVSFETEPNAEILVVDPTTPVRRAASRQDLEDWVDEVRPDSEVVGEDSLHVRSSVSSTPRRGMMPMITTKRRAGTFTPESRMDMSIIRHIDMGDSPGPEIKTPTRPPTHSTFKTPTRPFNPSSTPGGLGVSSPFALQRHPHPPSTPFSVADILSLGQESRQANNTHEEPFVRTPIRKAMNPLKLEALELEGNMRQPGLLKDHGSKAPKLDTSLPPSDPDDQEEGLVLRRIKPSRSSPPKREQPANMNDEQPPVSENELEQVDERPQEQEPSLGEAQETERERILRQANVTEEQLKMSVEEFHRAYIAEQVAMIEMAAEALIQRFEEEGERVKQALMGGPWHSD
ncbi:hypothetical protein BGZ73_001063 [Actinomortierella ambigua]|nr:hypothetical protein BGZ73_001063 [Actinomortierella ambigua]